VSCNHARRKGENVFLQAIVTRAGAIYCETEHESSHEELIQKHCGPGADLVKVEFTWPEYLEQVGDLSTWNLKVCEEHVPDWFDAEAVRVELSKRVMAMMVTTDHDLLEGGPWLILRGRVHRVTGRVAMIRPEANLRFANLSGANLGGANMVGACLNRADLERAILRGANLSCAKLVGANLSESNLSRADLSHADLRQATLYHSLMREACLRDANLSEANLCRAHLIQADMREANLREAHLWKAHLEESNLEWATFFGTEIEGANLRGANLDEAWWTMKTAPPEGWVMSSGERLKRVGG